MNTNKVILGTISGFVIGAIAGIVFAPKKGSATRKQLLFKGRDFVERLKLTFGDLFIVISDEFETHQKEDFGFADKASNKFKEVKKDLKYAAANFKDDGAADITHTPL